MKVIIKPDMAKAKSLGETSIITLSRLKETDMEKYPSNTLKDYYDIIKGLLEALLYMEGVKMMGESSHYETIEYACERYKMGESTRVFLQEMRDYRNRFSYEGFSVQGSYIRLNRKKIDEIVQKLIGLVDEKIS
ncbi:MAG: hypothetical protein QME12_02235 [Nanoarchaeota archaeon]|nr:hypothetical protein [Nanoarchaeota archaeon]